MMKWANVAEQMENTRLRDQHSLVLLEMRSEHAQVFAIFSMNTELSQHSLYCIRVPVMNDLFSCAV
jgi:hypothetical protein